MKNQTSEYDKTLPRNLHYFLVECLDELGGREFILDWAKSNPSDFIHLLTKLPPRFVEERPEPPEHVAPIIYESSATSVETDVPRVGAFDRMGAAEYLSISSRLLDDLLSAGVIRKLKIGRKTLVRKIDLDHYLEKLAEGAGAQQIKPC